MSGKIDFIIFMRSLFHLKHVLKLYQTLTYYFEFSYRKQDIAEYHANNVTGLLTKNTAENGDVPFH